MVKCHANNYMLADLSVAAPKFLGPFRRAKSSGYMYKLEFDSG